MTRTLASTLAGRVTGPVFLPGQNGFEEELTGFNLAVRHRPDVIVGAREAGDVAAAVEAAVAHGLPVAVQSAGHGFSVPATGGVLISTRRMTGVQVDPGTRTARVAAGARLGQVIAEAAPYGLAPLNGSAPHVGVVAYMLGGGLALLGRSHGWAADRVLALDVVTADGRARRVTPDSEPDLYWALVGGRDNVGVVTALEFGLVEVSRLYGGGLFFDARLAPGVLEAYREWTAGVPAEMNSSLALIPGPDGRLCHVRIAYTGPAEEGERLVEPLRRVGPRVLETLREMPYAECASIHDDPPTPMPWGADNAMLRELDEKAAGIILAHAGPEVIVELRHLGGALAAPPARPNAVGHRDAAFMLAVLTMDGRPAPAEVFRELEPWTLGRFLSFMGHGEAAGPELVRTAYPAAHHARLAAIKAVYDPGNVFRFNYNVAPAS
ncbi:FAD-binding oxidoreductase [Nonomuraea sp. NPDC049725]|uniref:FAD-binding oxidoreductase n=1 Tax=Nonomuraea sp. NPDC049725 TaxID=3154508 RepID=UPI00341DDA57